MDFLSDHQPEMLPGKRQLPPTQGVIEAPHGTTIVAVLHDLALASHFFPRLVLLDGGRIVADGPPSEVLTPDRIRDVFGVDPAFVRLPA